MLKNYQKKVIKKFEHAYNTKHCIEKNAKQATADNLTLTIVNFNFLTHFPWCIKSKISTVQLVSRKPHCVDQSA